MKSKLGLLLKINFLNSFKLKSTSTKKKIGMSILILYVVGVLLVSFGLFLNELFKSLSKVGLTSTYITMVFALASIFAIFFSIFNAKNNLFDNKDNDLVLSLPVKRSEVFASRLLQLTIYNFLLGLGFIVPGVGIYIYHLGIDLYTIISVIFLTLFFAIIPTIVSSLFGYLVAVLTSKSKSKSMMELLFYTLFIFIYLFIFYGSGDILNSLLSNVDLLNTILKTVFLPIYLISQVFTTHNLIYILYFIIINVGVLYLFILVFKNNYLKVISKLNAHITKGNYKMKSIESKSAMKALKEKEIKKYFSSAIYVFNTIFGVFMILIAAGASFFYSSDVIASFIGEEFKLNSFTLVFFLLLFVITLTDTTNSSISIERKNFWILKMIPVKTKDIFKAKTFVNKLILIPACILSLLLFYINGYINIIEMLLLIVITFTYGYYISNFGLIANLLFPKLDAINDTVIVKQSAASMIGILGGLGIFIIAVILLTSLSLTNNLLLVVFIIISLILYLISELILNNWGIRKFNDIN